MVLTCNGGSLGQVSVQPGLYVCVSEPQDEQCHNVCKGRCRSHKRLAADPGEGAQRKGWSVLSLPCQYGVSHIHTQQATDVCFG